MTEHEKPREWEITREGIVTGTGELASEAVRVIEAEPVEREREEMLDLIERFRDLPENCAHHSSRRNRCRDEASTVLRKHGGLSND